MAKKGVPIILILIGVMVLGLVAYLWFAPSSVTVEHFQTAPASPNVINGSWVGRDLPILATNVDNLGNKVYIAYDVNSGGYTKMVNSQGVSKYYVGLPTDYLPSNWTTYGSAPDNSYVASISATPPSPDTQPGGAPVPIPASVEVPPVKAPMSIIAQRKAAAAAAAQAQSAPPVAVPPVPGKELTLRPDPSIIINTCSNFGIADPLNNNQRLFSKVDCESGIHGVWTPTSDGSRYGTCLSYDNSTNYTVECAFLNNKGSTLDQTQNIALAPTIAPNPLAGSSPAIQAMVPPSTLAAPMPVQPQPIMQMQQQPAMPPTLQQCASMFTCQPGTMVPIGGSPYVTTNSMPAPTI